MSTHPSSPVRPPPLRRGQVEQALHQLLPADKIQELARETGFVRRARSVRPVAFLWTLVLDFGVELHRHLEELRAGYVERTDLPLS